MGYVDTRGKHLSLAISVNETPFQVQIILISCSLLSLLIKFVRTDLGHVLQKDVNIHTLTSLFLSI